MLDYDTSARNISLALPSFREVGNTESMVLCTLLALSGMTLAAIQEKREPEYKMEVVQLVFLVEGDIKIKMSAEQAEKMQAEHLKLLEGLWSERKAILVGPLTDAGKYRGLIALHVKTRDEALDLLKNDPFIKSGILAVEPYGWYTATNIPEKGPKFLDLETYWFGFLRTPANAPTFDEAKSKEIQAGHMANINAMAATGDLVLAGPIAEKGDFRGVFIFRTKDKAKVEEMASKDPAIKAGRLKLELFQWQTAKGTFPKKPK